MEVGFRRQSGERRTLNFEFVNSFRPSLAGKRHVDQSNEFGGGDVRRECEGVKVNEEKKREQSGVGTTPTVTLLLIINGLQVITPFSFKNSYFYEPKIIG